jgi:hypothetical protein
MNKAYHSLVWVATFEVLPGMEIRIKWVSARPPPDKVVPNLKGFQQGLFVPWIHLAKMLIDPSPIPRPFGFLLDTDSNLMVEQILN